MATGIKGNVKLNNKAYQVGNYQRFDGSDFSPRASTPGGSVVHSDMSLYQPLLQTDWRHGLGFHWYVDVAGYMRTEGNIDTRHAGVSMLYPAFSTLDTDTNRKDGFCVFKDIVYSWGPAGIRRLNSIWSTVYTGAVNCVLSTSKYIFIFPDGGRPLRSETGDADTGAYAIAVTNMTGNNNDLYFVAKSTGTGGNAISVTFVDDVTNPNPPTVTVVGSAITVNVDAGVTLASAVKTAIAGKAAANALIAVGYRPGNTGAGAVTAMSALYLTGGSTNGRKAELTTQQSTANSNLKFTAVTPGTDGNNISVMFQTGAAAAGQEIITVSGTDITVTLHADSTALQVLNAILSDVPANATGSTKLSGDNNDLTFTAVTAGVAGNDITVTYKLGAASVGLESCAVSGSTITITMHKSSTASHIIDIIRRTPSAAALVTVVPAPGNSGAGKPAPSSAKSTWTVTTGLKGGSTVSAGSLVTVELASGNTGVGKPGAMAKLNLYGGSGSLSWVETGVDADAKDYRWAVIHNGRVYAGEDNNNLVHYASQTDLSDLEGTENDPGVIKVGAGNIPTLGAIVYAGNLYLSKEDGLWQLAEDGSARQVLNYSNESSDTNFRSMVVHNGYLIYPVRDRLIQWNGVRESAVTPGKITDTWPYVTYGRFDNLVAANGYLYLSARTNETNYKEDLLCWDGVGWHRLANILSATSPAAPYTSAMNYTVNDNSLCIAVYSAAGCTSSYIKFQDQSDFMPGPFPTGSTSYLYLSRMDMGFRRIIKSSPSVIVESAGCSSDCYLTVDYSLDGSTSFTTIGTVMVNGVVELPMTSTGGTKEYNYIQPRIGFTTTDSLKTPVLEGITMRFLLRPEVHYAYSFVIPVATDQESGKGTNKISARSMLIDLETARDSKSPVAFTDIWGVVHKVYVTSIREVVYEQNAEDAKDSEYELGVQVNLLETD